jgi:hypothetical protein
LKPLHRAARSHFISGQHHRQALGSFCANERAYVAEIYAEHLLIEKNERAECLVLGRRRDLAAQ